MYEVKDMKLGLVHRRVTRMEATCSGLFGWHLVQVANAARAASKSKCFTPVRRRVRLPNVEARQFSRHLILRTT